MSFKTTFLAQILTNSLSKKLERLAMSISISNNCLKTRLKPYKNKFFL